MFCKECGAWLGDGNVQFCNECGTNLESNIGGQDGLQTKIGNVAKETGRWVVTLAQEVMGEAVEDTKANVGKRVLKKGKKLTNTILKEVGLKRKTPIDVIKKTAKKTIKKLTK